MHIQFKNVENFDTLIPYVQEDQRSEFIGSSGVEHYRFLAYLSTLFDGFNLIDIGTHRGSSAVALSYNQNNKVISFDIEMKCTVVKDNITFVIDNIFEKLEVYKEALLNAPIIMLDIDPHDGYLEYQLYQFLKENNYQGLLVCDDIWHFPSMRNNFWYLIEDRFKYDLTEWGHWSGTGIVSFTNFYQLPKYKTDNWTLVTAYFNLTKCPDASNEIKARSQAYYLQHAYSTLCLPMNLVIYCDADSYPLIQQIRPPYLADRTKYVVGEFDDFIIAGKNFAELREEIRESRIKKPYNFDPRNVPSYYLFCMSRYLMLRNEIRENIFGSTHFAWINICIERYGIHNVRLLPLALSVNREKFSTCYIDYVPPEIVFDDDVYWQYGRCTMESGFFTGNQYYMDQFCKLILEKFRYYLDRCRNHADEQLYSPVFFENPEIFEHFFGDYNEMITNYVYSYYHPEKIIYNFIRNSFQYKNYTKCLEACEFLIEGLRLKKCSLNPDYMNQLAAYYLQSKINA